MKRKNYLLIPPFLFLLVILIGYANNIESPVGIDNIFVQPGKLSTKIILNTNSPLPEPKTYYSKDTPSTIVVELNNVKIAKKPQFTRKGSSLIADMKIEKTGANKIRFLINLKEPVPYRIITNHKSTVVELTKIQRALKDYVFDSETKKELEKKPKEKISLDRIDVSETKDRVNITAKLSSDVVSNVFALDNPLRLVVDLFDTLYSNSTFVRPIKKLGVEKVRAAQFQYSNPNTITRIVFDLKEAKHYALNSAKGELTISFFKDQASLALPKSQTPAPKKTESEQTKTRTIEKILKEFEKRTQKEPKDAIKTPEAKQTKETTPKASVKSKGEQKDKKIKEKPVPVKPKTEQVIEKISQKAVKSEPKEKEQKSTSVKPEVKKVEETTKQKPAISVQKDKDKELKGTPIKPETKQVIEKISQEAVKSEPKVKEPKETPVKPEEKPAKEASKTQQEASKSIQKDKDKELSETLKKTELKQTIGSKPTLQKPVKIEPEESKESVKKAETKEIKETKLAKETAPQKAVKTEQPVKAKKDKEAQEKPSQKSIKGAQKEKQPEETIVLPKTLQRPPETTEKTEDSRSKSTPPVPNQAQQQQFRPRTIAEEEQKFEGTIMDLRVKDADLRDVILSIGEIAGLNTVFDPEVRGTVTCDLKDVPWDQALDLILKINKMGKTIEGNVLRIAPVGTITREREELNRLRQSEELAEPLIVRTFRLSYSKVSEVQNLLRTRISQRGEIISDTRTNTLIITDVRTKIELMESLISVFDTPTPQVTIEARIVEATATFVRNLGIQWGFRGISDPFYGNQTSLQFPHKILADGALIPQGTVTRGISGPLGGYAINLPAPSFNTALGISFGNVLDTFRLDMALSALESSGEGRIISCPRITTQNNKEAEIIQGRQIPVQTVANFTTTVRYQNAALELRATPQITAEGTIIIDVDIRNNAADFANLVNGIPPLITQSASMTVMVADGGTTVIGGIYRTEDSITREKVPFLHKIPILGALFKNFARTRQNRELLIFITPRITRL
ncbi:MAG: type IV pilus secretin PilQ [Candidatus Aminicenantes bacterium]|nr:MAG: type IV pilus secretin PilQ [Candidatus Aminicenantes bacterium]